MVYTLVRGNFRLDFSLAMDIHAEGASGLIEKGDDARRAIHVCGVTFQKLH